MSGKIIVGNQVYLSKPTTDSMNEFLEKTNASRDLHALWTKPPLNKEQFFAYLERIDRDNQEGFIIKLNKTSEMIGVINVNEIVKGDFNSGYLGYYCFSGYEKQGVMSEGLRLLLQYVFNTMKLHRLEANIQPANINSILLVKRCGFINEGFSKKYLRINGTWEDHIRYALTVENFERKSKADIVESSFNKYNGNIIIRHASSEDLSQIINLLADDELGKKRENTIDPPAKSYVDAINEIVCDDNAELVVVEMSDKIIGVAQINYLRYLTYQGGKRAQIEGVRIQKKHQGKGLGKILFQDIIDRAKAKKCHVVQLTTDKLRPEALSFYEKLGFQQSHHGLKLHLKS